MAILGCAGLIGGCAYHRLVGGGGGFSPVDSKNATTSSEKSLTGLGNNMRSYGKAHGYKKKASAVSPQYSRLRADPSCPTGM